MADEKVITLVAVERGFRDGKMVEPGKKFPFVLVSADGKQHKLPKWAVREGDPSLSKAKKAPASGDIRPADAIAASKGKAVRLSNDLAG
jgi:hypothetical protein